jgi:hypothetical protein
MAQRQPGGDRRPAEGNERRAARDSEPGVLCDSGEQRSREREPAGLLRSRR